MRKQLIDPTFGDEYVDDGQEHSNAAISGGVVIDAGTHKQVFLTGLIADDEAGSAFDAQLRDVFDGIDTYLTGIGGAMSDIVRLRIFVSKSAHTDSNMAALQRIRREYLAPDHFPASTLLIVDGLIDDSKHVEVETDAIIPAGDWETE